MKYNIHLLKQWTTLIISILLFLVLSACNQANNLSIPKSNLKSTPALYSSEELASAIAVNITSVTELEGEDLNNEEINIELPDVEENVFEESDLTTQDVLPMVNGIAAYYRTDGNTYQIWIYNQATSVRTNIYSSTDEVQSVAVDSSGSLVVASIKNPANGFFDIYVFDEGKPILNLSNTNDRDELDVSVTADGTKIVWSGPASNGRIRVKICEYDLATQSCAISKLGNANAKDQRQPSITSNGEYIALIRDISGGKLRIFLYDFMNNTYITVVTERNEVRHPSASDDGKHVMFIKIKGIKRKIKIKDRDTNVIANELTSKTIEEAHMTSSGDYYIFDSFTTGHQRVFTANVDTNDRARVAAGSWGYGGGFWQQCSAAAEVKLTAGENFDRFGWSVAISGDTAVVGAPLDNATDINSGSVYVYERDTCGEWVLVKKIITSDEIETRGDEFGSAVAISGDTVVVVASRDGHSNPSRGGSAYIFERNSGGNNNWGQVKKIIAPEDTCCFGFVNSGSVAILGDILVVGNPNDDNDNGESAGSAHIFERNNGGSNNWGLIKKILASDGEGETNDRFAGDNFGESVAISGNTLVVGAFIDDNDNGESAGSAYIFERNNGGSNNWGETKKILASDGTIGDWFGGSVAILGDTVVVGAELSDGNVSSSGSAYIFERNSGGSNNWGEVKKILASDGAVRDHFGTSVAISGDTLVVGASQDTSNDAKLGKAYTYERNNGGSNNWGEVKKILASDGADNNQFGQSVAISGNIVVVGAYNSRPNSVYIYE